MVEFEFVGKSLYFPEKKILCIADLHIGYEEMLNEAGVFLPRTQFSVMKSEMREIVGKVKNIEEIIILGDLKHEFGRISRQEWKETLSFLDFLLQNCKKVVLVKGNHDTITEPIARKKGVEMKDYCIKTIGGKKVCFFHGHKMWSECYDKSVKMWVVGHKHPAICIRKGVKAEIYKCFLVGNYKKKKVIVLPSFFPLVEGSDIFLMEETNLAFSPNLKNFEVYVIADKIYDFGKVKDVGKIIE